MAVSVLRGRHLFLIDAIGLILAGVAALGFRLGAVGLKLDWTFVALGLLFMARIVVNFRMGLYAHAWRYASYPDMARIVTAGVGGTVVGATAIVIAGAARGTGLGPWLPLWVYPVELLFALLVLGGSRFAIRAASDLSARSSNAAATRPTLLYGAGQVGVTMARAAWRDPSAGVQPVGFLDDDPHLVNGNVAGLPVFGGLDQLEGAVEGTGAKALLITMSNAPGEVVRRVVNRAMALGLDVHTVPAMSDLLDGTIDARRIRRVRVEDLLRRPTAQEHAPAVQGLFTDRVVVVTGAAGSIGSELARQVHAMKPKRLVLVDRAESPLYLLLRQLEERGAHGQGGGELRAHLANVASRTVMARMIADERPDIILHAAAYKHVPLMETHPSDAIYVNITGTLALLDAAAAAGVERFVLVSTDKAVEPSSVMGASKRVAEMLVADTARRTGRPYVAVRFGNVLGSAGSVVPIFQEQLENGQPLTITHPDMTRFFMTIPEAAWLILDAAALGRNGDLFVLDMGEPVKVVDLARDLIRLSGRDPEAQPIEFMGLRPGEKLHEELFYQAENVEPTATPKVLRAVAPPPPATVRDDVRILVELANGEQDEALCAALHRCARGLGAGPVSDARAARNGKAAVPAVDLVAVRVHSDRAATADQPPLPTRADD